MVKEGESINFILVFLAILTQTLSYFPRNAAVLCSIEGCCRGCYASLDKIYDQGFYCKSETAGAGLNWFISCNFHALKLIEELNLALILA